VNKKVTRKEVHALGHALILAIQAKSSNSLSHTDNCFKKDIQGS
jgi:hypothetical protein